jgi:hypothetical protein
MAGRRLAGKLHVSVCVTRGRRSQAMGLTKIGGWGVCEAVRSLHTKTNFSHLYVILN